MQLQHFSPTQFLQTSLVVFLNHKMLQTFFFKYWFWDLLHKISLQPNSTRLLFMCSWITKCSKSSSSSSSSSSSNSSFGDDYQKSLSNRIPPDFCLCVLESQNAPNHHHHRLLLPPQILVLGMTTKNLSPTEFLQTFVYVFLNHKMFQIFFICFYFVGPHIKQRWRCFESFTFIILKSFGLFWGAGVGVCFQLSKSM